MVQQYSESRSRKSWVCLDATAPVNSTFFFQSEKVAGIPDTTILVLPATATHSNPKLLEVESHGYT